MFDRDFHAVTGFSPLAWQSRLFTDYLGEGEVPAAVDIPTGLGKTAVMALWLIARARGASLPRRLVYVVDRRAVVDQATEFAIRLRANLDKPEAQNLKDGLGLNGRSLPISTLRGQHVDNREWLEDPSVPAIIVGTVDMVGSRILFEGYGVSRKMRPYHAGLLGADALVLLDEAHLVPPFEALLTSVAGGTEQLGPAENNDRALVPGFKVLPLSATSRTVADGIFRLEGGDYLKPDRSIACATTHQRLTAPKRLTMDEVGTGKLIDTLAERAWRLGFPDDRNIVSGKGKPSRVVVFCDRRDDAEKVKEALDKNSKLGKKSQVALAETELLIGARRVRERQRAAERLATLGFIAGSTVVRERPAFLVATSAGEVGVDLDADHMVCDLVPWERMVQRLGRVNRRGEGSADVIVLQTPFPEPKKSVAEALKKSEEKRSKKEAKAVGEHEVAVERHRALARPLDFLPHTSGNRDVSPLALMQLGRRANGEEDVRNFLRAATSQAPLRPALTRALVDAWAMTSLPEHTGRPEVQPWLRGWVADEPQTAVVWRRHLPIRSEAEPKAKDSEIETFFEAAPPHVSEILETETFRVVEWIQVRARRLVGKTPVEEVSDVGEAGPVPAIEAEAGAAEANDDSALIPADSLQPLKPGSLVGFVLSTTGTLERRLRLRDLTTEDKRQKESLENALKGRTLVLDARFGGLSKDGLLEEESPAPSIAADEPREAWLDPIEGCPVVPFRVRLADSGAENEGGLTEGWRSAHEFVIERSVDGEAIRVLKVEKWRDEPTTEDARSTGPAQTLAEHQSWVEQHARALAERLALPKPYQDVLTVAGLLHDEGKRAPRWQEAFHAPHKGGPYAKTRGPIRQGRLEGYRHEFGSLPYAERSNALQALPEDLRDLALHLVAAHHGFARPLIPTDGCDDAPPSELQERAREVALRFARLQRGWGPWGLAWWEALLRAADQQASRENEQRGKTLGGED